MQLDSLVATLDIRTEDLEQRLDALLRPARRVARSRLHPRARSRPRGVGSRAPKARARITEQYERVRDNAEDERRRAAEAMRAIFEQSTGDTHALFRDANERFAEAVAGMKQMAAEMQRELEATRTELRRGVFELPQETAESAAQMRRVIVDQIEALAELNRIVARHGRNLDAVEPVRRREEPTLAIVGGRNDIPAPPRHEFPPPPPRTVPRNEVGNFAPAARRAEAPALSPAQTTSPAAAGSAICSAAPRARKPSRRANSRASNRANTARAVAKPAARPCASRRARRKSARRATASSRWIRSRSTSPA